ncbi:MAG: T9SS type A sorting domain-containing protein [Saprospiraceae bacterium]
MYSFRKNGFLLLLLLFFFPPSMLAQCDIDWSLSQWSRRIPGDPWGANVPFRVAAGRDGALYMAGYAADSLFLQSAGGQEALVAGFGDTAFQLVVSKYGPDGGLLWAKGFGVGSFASFAPDVVAAGDDIFVCGTVFGGDRYAAFVARMGSEGDLKWVRTFNGTGDCWGYGLAASNAGRVFLTGRFSGAIESLGFAAESGFPQRAHSFLLSLDGEGELEWATRSETGRDSRGHPIAALPGGGVAIGGYFSDSLCWDAACIASGRNGGRTPYIAGFDEKTGALQWLKGAEPLPGDFPNGALYGLAADGAGNLYGAGFIQSGFSWGDALLEPSGNFENVLMSWTADGALRWTATFGSDDENDLEWASDLGVSPYQTLLAVAQVFPGAEVDGTAIPSRGESDVVALEFTLEGEYLRHWTIGGEGTEFAYGAALGPEGVLAVCGNTQSMDLYFRSGSVEIDTAQRTNSFLYTICLPLPPESRSGAGGEVIVFPNPSWGACWVEGDFAGEVVQVDIINATGQLLSREKVEVVPGRRQYPVHVGDLPAGVYYLRVTGQEGRVLFAVAIVLAG